MCHRKPVFAGVALAAMLAIGGLFAGCAQVQSVETELCARIAALPPQAVAILDAQDPHTAVGSLWAYQKSACVAGQPAAGVSPGFAAMIWGELKTLLPQVLPQLLPLLIGLL